MCHYASFVVLHEFRWLQMVRTPDFYFVVVILESKEGEIAVVIACVAY